MLADEKTTETEEVSRFGGGSLKKKIAIIGIPVFVLQLVLAYFFVGKIFRPPKTNLSPFSHQLQEAIGAGKLDKKDAKLGDIFMVPDVIVNPRGSGGRRYLNVTFGFECCNKATIKEFKKREIQIRDVLISILVSKSIDEVDGAKDKELLKKEVMEKVNQILSNGKIKAVYFSNFVVQ